jgi:hypothetical protein
VEFTEDFCFYFQQKTYCQQKPEGVKLGGYFGIQNNLNHSKEEGMHGKSFTNNKEE